MCVLTNGYKVVRGTTVVTTVDQYSLKSAYYTMKKGCAGHEDLRRPENRNPLREVAVKLLAPCRSLVHSVPQQTIASNLPITSSRFDGVTSVRPSSSCPRQQDFFFPTQRILGWPCFKEPANLLKTFESRIIDPPKTAAVLSSCSSTYNLTTKQRAPRSQKRAGAETTSRTTWIERPILHRFCLDNPQI